MKRKKLLLIEESSETAKKLMLPLNTEFEVTWVSGGLDALLLFGYQNYQVLILETNLPDTDGLQVVRTIRRYGFTLPMDDTLAQVALDFGGRSWLVWKAEFKREMIGQMPTEMFYHFFKSFADGAKANINIKAEGTNEHHKIESVFKAFAKAIKMAIKRDEDKMILPSTKGSL